MIKVGLLSLGSSDFNVKLAEENLKKSYLLLNRIENAEILYCPQVICDNENLDLALNKLIKESIDLLIVQAGTFFMGDMCINIIKKFLNTPLFVWGVEEPLTKSGKVELNSWTGFNLFTSILNRYDKKFSYTFGNVDDINCFEKITNTVKAIRLKKYLNTVKLGCIGSRVPGFYFSEADQLMIMDKVGPSVEYFDLETVFELGRKVTAEEVDGVIELIKKRNVNISIPSEEMEKTIRLYLGCKHLCKVENLDGLSLRCWPELQERYNMVGCGAVSLLTDDGIMTSCEGDVPGLITMIIQNKLTKETPFFTDLINFSKQDNSVTAWHCGQAPTCLSCSQACYVKHPTYTQGYCASVQSTLKKGEVSINKLSINRERINLFSAYGKAVPEKCMLDGSQLEISTDKSAEDIINVIVENGIEHHYSVVHRSIKELLKECCKWMDWNYLE